MPHPWARAAAEQVIEQIHHYMHRTPHSELHRLGKMFGILVIRDENGNFGYLKAFSSLLDGQHYIDGFVPPIFDFAEPTGYFRQEEAAISAINRQLESTDLTQTDKSSLRAERKSRSQALQRWLFSQYQVRSAIGQTRDLIDIFAQVPPILSAEDYFYDRHNTPVVALPPSGAGECCAPKLLQYAILNHLTPMALAEFWIGAAPKNELRRDGYFYGACQGKCRPILNHMLQGMDIEPDPDKEILPDSIEVLYQDQWLLIAMKPNGLLTTAGKNNTPCLEQLLQQRFNNPHIKAVHRLDQDTSGLVVLSQCEDAYSKLQTLFRNRLVFKRYEAIVEHQPGYTIPPEGEISLPLLPNPFDRPRQMVDYQHGKTARTKYKVRKQLAENRVFIDLFPLTGRTHQLRVHCAHPDGLNAPIVGDPLYGIPSDRLYLHAAEMQFTHPYTSKTVRLQVSL